jgi:hypothetical protein
MTGQRVAEVPRTMPVQPAAPATPAESPRAAAVRLFAGFAGFGAGCVNLAICSSLSAGAAGGPGLLQVAAAAVAGLWGAGLLTGTVVSLAKGRVPSGRAALIVLTAAAALHVGAIAFATAETSVLNLSQLTALLLTLIIIAAGAWLRRFTARVRPGHAAAPAAPRPGMLLLAAFAGAVLVAGITTPGLAASAAGQYAVPHGQHGGSLQQDSHHRR